MSSEKYANNAASTLNATIINTDTSLVVVSATGFPTTPQFRIRIEDEIIIVGAVAGTTFSSLTRGAEGTTAVGHTSGLAVTHVLTKGALDQIIADDLQFDTLANLPAAEKAGRLYLPTDSFYYYRDNGSSWDAFGPAPRPMYPPVDANYSWINQGSATVTSVGGAIHLSTPTGGDSLKIRELTPPATPYTLTVYLLHEYNAVDGQGGICFRESATGKIYSIQRSGHAIEVIRWNSATSFSALQYSQGATFLSRKDWFQIRADGTNIHFASSMGGYNFTTHVSVAKASFFTTAPDRIGFFASAGQSAVTLLSWKVT